MHSLDDEVELHDESNFLYFGDPSFETDEQEAERDEDDDGDV